jgi:hypothetical protein
MNTEVKCTQPKIQGPGNHDINSYPDRNFDNYVIS